MVDLTSCLNAETTTFIQPIRFSLCSYQNFVLLFFVCVIVGYIPIGCIKYTLIGADFVDIVK